jgi:hypothetical protein
MGSAARNGGPEGGGRMPPTACAGVKRRSAGLGGTGITRDTRSRPTRERAGAGTRVGLPQTGQWAGGSVVCLRELDHACPC